MFTLVLLTHSSPLYNNNMFIIPAQGKHYVNNSTLSNSFYDILVIAIFIRFNKLFCMKLTTKGKTSDREIMYKNRL